MAAVGNADQAPDTPWRFASYPAALPHVLGVSALTRSGVKPTLRRGQMRFGLHAYNDRGDIARTLEVAREAIA